MAGLAASWGAVAVLVSWVDLGSAALTFSRLALGALTLGVVALARGGIRRLAPGRALPALVVLGVLQGAHWLLFIAAVKLGSVALAVITFYAAPLLIALAAPAVLREPLDRVVLAALLPGTAGVVLVALSGDDGGGAFSLAAVAAGLGSAATFAGIVLASRRLVTADTAPLTVAFWDLTVGTAVVAPFLATSDRVLPAGGREWGAVLALGVALTGLSVLAYAALLTRVTAQSSSVLTFLEPVVAVLLAAALLDEPLTAGTLAGGVLVCVAGLLVVARAPATRPPVPE